MNYVYKCPECGRRIEIDRPVKDRNDFIPCYHYNDGSLHVIGMKRFFTVPFINCNLQKDNPENDVGRILSGSSSKRDQLGVMREDAKKYEDSRKNWDTSEPKYTSVDDILSMGLRPDMTREAVQNWREKNIPKDNLATA